MRFANKIEKREIFFSVAAYDFEKNQEKKISS